MFKRIAAISFIFVCTSIAWAILGTTIFSRTYASRTGLRNRVESTWGAPHEQKAPWACYDETVLVPEEPAAGAGRGTRLVQKRVSHALPLQSSDIRVQLDLEPRQKGLLWYSTYRVAFAGAYVIRNTSDQERLVTFSFPLPVKHAVYDELTITADGRTLPIENEQTAAVATARLAPGAGSTFAVSYRSQGLDRWRYGFGSDVAQVRDFRLRMRTDFKQVDFPENTLSPVEKREIGEGWDLTWQYKNLISGFQIGMEMPARLQPGPVAGEISYFAPVSLLFFFFLMFIITVLRGIELHPMNYFFLAGAFFSFHLLLAYLVDHISIHLAFVICSAVSIFLVISYLRLVVGLRFAAVEAGLAQLIFLVLFSYAFFFEGLTGLAITIGSIVTLFVVMQMTARVRWAEAFGGGGARIPTRPATQA